MEPWNHVLAGILEMFIIKWSRVMERWDAQIVSTENIADQC